MWLAIKHRGIQVTAAALVVLVALWLWFYRPWEAHFLGRPTSYWAERLRELPDDRALLLQDISPGDWLSSNLQRFGLKVHLRPVARELVCLGHDSVPVLIELLRDRDTHVRKWAARILSGINPRPKQAIPALIEAWEKCKGDYRGSACPYGLEYGNAVDAAMWIYQAICQIDPEASKTAGVWDSGPEIEGVPPDDGTESDSKPAE